MSDSESRHYEVLVLGAGVSGIYQIKSLLDAGFHAAVLEADDDLGGTWYRNRYPGARFDSESYTYGYSFSQEVLDEWHWQERFSGQPENLRYLNFVVDKFDLRKHMRFNARVSSMHWDATAELWRVQLEQGDAYTARFVVTGIGVLSVPTPPKYPGMDVFRGESFHTYWWPHEPVDLRGKRVGVIGTGATGIQVIGEIASQVKELVVFQRRPNWSAPLNNSPISAAEMAEIRSRYDEIFERCRISPNGFEHMPPAQRYRDLTHEQRVAIWDDLYDKPGFAILAGNFTNIFVDEQANREISDYIAQRIRDRVNDPDIAEQLIPKDHGFGTQRLPLETNYFEVYNRDNVRLVNLKKAPIETLTEQGVQTSDAHYDLDVVVFATGFNAITGGFEKIDITGVDGQRLADKWSDGPSTYLGLTTQGFPNLLMVAGPQSISGSTNFPRAIEGGVEWVTELLQHARAQGYNHFDVRPPAEAAWGEEVAQAFEKLLARNSKGWFTGYNSNLAGHEAGTVRYQAYFGGGPKYATLISEEAAAGYPGLEFG